jgi:uncharacterized protein (TIGR03083 family)
MTVPSVMRPGPDRHRTLAGLLDEYRSFAQLTGALDDSEWTRETRCVGWQVRDVAAHVVGQAIDTVSGTIGSRTPDDQAAALRSESPIALAAQLNTALASITQLVTVIDDAVWSAPSPVPDLTLGQGIHALLQDAYVHGDDVRATLGLPHDDGPGLHASVDFVLGALQRDDIARVEPAIARVLVIPAEHFAQQSGMASYDFLLAATGRRDPAPLQLPESVNIFR